MNRKGLSKLFALLLVAALLLGNVVSVSAGEVPGETAQPPATTAGEVGEETGGEVTTTPPTEGGETATPPADSGTTAPPADGGATTPPASSGSSSSGTTPTTGAGDQEGELGEAPAHTVNPGSGSSSTGTTLGGGAGGAGAAGTEPAANETEMAPAVLGASRAIDDLTTADQVRDALLNIDPALVLVQEEWRTGENYPVNLFGSENFPTETAVTFVIKSDAAIQLVPTAGTSGYTVEQGPDDNILLVTVKMGLSEANTLAQFEARFVAHDTANEDKAEIWIEEIYCSYEIPENPEEPKVLVPVNAEVDYDALASVAGAQNTDVLKVELTAIASQKWLFDKMNANDNKKDVIPREEITTEEITIGSDTVTVVDIAFATQIALKATVRDEGGAAFGTNSATGMNIAYDGTKQFELQAKITFPDVTDPNTPSQGEVPGFVVPSEISDSLSDEWTLLYDASVQQLTPAGSIFNEYFEFHTDKKPTELSTNYNMFAKLGEDGSILLQYVLTESGYATEDQLGSATFSHTLTIKKVQFATGMKPTELQKGAIKIEYMEDSADSFSVANTPEGADVTKLDFGKVSSSTKMDQTFTFTIGAEATLEERVQNLFNDVAKAVVPWKYSSTGDNNLGQSGDYTREYVSNRTFENGFQMNRIWFQWTGFIGLDIPEGADRLTITEKTGTSYDDKDMYPIGFLLPSFGEDNPTVATVTGTIDGTGFSISSDGTGDAGLFIKTDSIYVANGNKHIQDLQITYTVDNSDKEDDEKVQIQIDENPQVLFMVNPTKTVEEYDFTDTLDNKSLVALYEDVEDDDTLLVEKEKIASVGYKEFLPDAGDASKTYKNEDEARKENSTVPGDNLTYTVVFEIPAANNDSEDPNHVGYLEDIWILDEVQKDYLIFDYDDSETNSETNIVADVNIVKADGSKSTLTYSGIMGYSTYTNKADQTICTQYGLTPYNDHDKFQMLYCFEGKFYPGDQIVITYTAKVGDVEAGEVIQNDVYYQAFTGMDTPPETGGSGPWVRERWGEKLTTLKVAVQPRLLYGSIFIDHNRKELSTAAVVPGLDITYTVRGGLVQSEVPVLDPVYMVELPDEIILTGEPTDFVLRAVITSEEDSNTLGDSKGWPADATLSFKYYDENGDEVFINTDDDYADVKMIIITINGMVLGTETQGPHTGQDGLTSSFYSDIVEFQFPAEAGKVQPDPNKDNVTLTVGASFLGGKEVMPEDSDRSPTEHPLDYTVLIRDIDTWVSTNKGLDNQPGLSSSQTNYKYVYTKVNLLGNQDTRVGLAKDAEMPDNAASLNVGDEITFTIDVFNISRGGISDEEGEDFFVPVIVDILPPDMEYVDNSATLSIAGEEAAKPTPTQSPVDSIILENEGLKSQQLVFTINDYIPYQTSGEVGLAGGYSNGDYYTRMRLTYKAKLTDTKLLEALGDPLLADDVWNYASIYYTYEDTTWVRPSGNAPDAGSGTEIQLQEGDKVQQWWGFTEDEYDTRLTARAQVAYSQQRVAPGVKKELVSNAVVQNIQGANAEWKITVQNGVGKDVNVTNLTNFYVIDVLPEGFTFISASLGDPDGTFTNKEGRQVVYWNFDKTRLESLQFGDGLPSGKSFNFTLKTEAKEGVIGEATNDVYLMPYGGQDFLFGDVPAGTYVSRSMDNAYYGLMNARLTQQSGQTGIALEKNAVHSSAVVKITSAEGASAVKSVTNEAGATASGTADPLDVSRGELVTYNYEIENNGQNAFTEVEVYDLLPAFEDKSLVLGIDRNSRWGPAMIGSSITATLSKKDDSDEQTIATESMDIGYFYGDVPNVSGGGASGVWKGLAWEPEKAENPFPTAFRVRFQDVEIPVGYKLTLTWDMEVPTSFENDSQVLGTIAYNSAAFSLKAGKASAFAEPPKCGIRLMGDSNLSLVFEKQLIDADSTEPVILDFVLQWQGQNYHGGAQDDWYAYDLKNNKNVQVGPEATLSSDVVGGFSLTVQPGKKISVTINGLPEANFRVQEISNSGYDISYENGIKELYLTNDTSGDNITMINLAVKEPEEFALEVNKRLVDNESSDKATFNFTIERNNDGKWEPVPLNVTGRIDKSGNITVSPIEGNKGKFSITLEPGETRGGKIMKLPAGEYRVTEELSEAQAAYYTVTNETSTVTVSENNATPEILVTNTHTKGQDPKDPKDPKDPDDPSGPLNPEDPKDPTDPVDPNNPTDPKDPTDPTDPNKPNPNPNPPSPQDPTGPPTDPDPTDPTNPPTPTPTDPVDPIDPTDPVDPVTPTDPVDPVTPVTPTDPTTPTDPVTPVTPTPTPATPVVPAPVPAPVAAPAPGAGLIVPGAPAAAAAAAPVADAAAAAAGPGGAVTIGGLDFDGGIPTTTIDFAGIPLFGQAGIAWSLLNLMCSIVGLLVSIVLFVGIFRKRKQENELQEEVPEDEQQDPIVRAQAENAEAEGEEEEDPKAVRKKKATFVLKLLTIFFGILTGVLFLIFEDIRLPMTWITQWTYLIVPIFVVHIISLIVYNATRRKKKVKDDEDGDDQDEEGSEHHSGGYREQQPLTQMNFIQADQPIEQPLQ